MKTFAFILLMPALPLLAADVAITTGPPKGAPNAHYTGNRPPLLSTPFVRLPIGTVQPQGWVRRQLELMADGFTGRLSEISRFCRYEGNSWTTRDGSGEYGWEEVPYWLKGFADLGILLNEPRIKAETQKWIEAVLATQREDGYFGPGTNLRGFSHLENLRTLDLWPNMIMLYVLRTWHDATGDPRIVPFMTRYFRWQASLPLEKFLPASWQKWRGGDNLDSIYWLYNRTGEPWLLDLARVNHERTADWVGGIPTWHGVNLAQCFREPAQYYQQTKDERYLKATERNYDTVISIYGQQPGGMYGADENVRPGFNDARNAAETCTMVELMHSEWMLASITGDSKWADRVEEIAFNSLPASMTPDLKALHYLTAPNMVQLDRQSKAPMFDNGGDMLSYNPYQFRCCQHNVAFGWPYFAETMWMATPGNGLAAMFYGAGKVGAKAGPGVNVTIDEQTDYPFTESIHFMVTPERATRFPLTLRIPGWTTGPKLLVNGNALIIPAAHNGWITLERVWQPGDKLQLELPMRTEVRKWERTGNSVSVYRGPLAYSLKIGERWESYGINEKWRAWEVFPTTAWNYGLELDAAKPEAGLHFTGAKGPVPPQPWTPDAVPVSIKAKARRIPEWKQEANGLVGALQPSPAFSDQPSEEVTLIPLGAARLRIASFPTASSQRETRRWREDIPVVTASSPSHSYPPTAAIDDVIQTSVGDPTAPKFLWERSERSAEWIQLTFGKPRPLSFVEVYWVDESSISGSSRLPNSWKVMYWDGKQWQPVTSAGDYGAPDRRVARVAFSPVTTGAIRIEAELQPRFTAGIIEWRYGVEATTASR